MWGQSVIVAGGPKKGSMQKNNKKQQVQQQEQQEQGQKGRRVGMRCEINVHEQEILHGGRPRQPINKLKPDV